MQIESMPPIDEGTPFDGVYFIVYESDPAGNGDALAKFVHAMEETVTKVSIAVFGADIVRVTAVRACVFGKHMFVNDVEQYRIVVKLPENCRASNVIDLVSQELTRINIGGRLNFISGDYASWSLVQEIDENDIYRIK